MVKFGVFYHHAWGDGKKEIPPPDLNYIRTDPHKNNEIALDVFDSRMDAQNRAELLNSRMAKNQTGQHYVAPTTQETKTAQKRFKFPCTSIYGWK